MSVPSGTKFIGIASNVDTLERKSALANSPSQVYTIEDIADVARPYKVYTALLTQSGGDNPENFTWNYGEPEPPIPEIQYGVTYLIVANDSATDFTVCGAPNNNAGTYFVANGIQPDWSEPYEDGSIGISWNTGAPVVTVLENTIGNIWFGYGDNGIPHIYSDLLFKENKTYLTIGGYSYSIDDVGTFRNSFYYNNADLLRINTQTTNNGYDWDFSNDILNNTPIEIRVYN